MKTLRILIQSNGAALLLDGHAGLVARAEGDGAHLTGTDALQAATPRLKPKYIAGCGGLGSATMPCRQFIRSKAFFEQG